MPGGKSPGPSIKDPALYEKLKKKFIADGMDEAAAKGKAARISNAAHEKANA